MVPLPIMPTVLAPTLQIPGAIVVVALVAGFLAAKVINVLSQSRGAGLTLGTAAGGRIGGRFGGRGPSPLVGVRRRATLSIPLLFGAILALGWLLAYNRFGLSWSGALAAALCFFLIVVTVVDLRTHLIPDPLLVGGAVVLAPLALLTKVTPWRQGLLGFVVCGGFLLLLAIVGRGNMGGGDVKLGALVGLALGWPLGGLALLLGFVAGAVAGLALILLKLKRRDGLIAFGPFISLGVAVALFWGETILALYF